MKKSPLPLAGVTAWIAACTTAGAVDRENKVLALGADVIVDTDISSPRIPEVTLIVIPDAWYKRKLREPEIQVIEAATQLRKPILPLSVLSKLVNVIPDFRYFMSYHGVAYNPDTQRLYFPRRNIAKSTGKTLDQIAEDSPSLGF